MILEKKSLIIIYKRSILYICMVKTIKAILSLPSKHCSYIDKKYKIITVLQYNDIETNESKKKTAKIRTNTFIYGLRTVSHSLIQTSKPQILHLLQFLLCPKSTQDLLYNKHVPD